MRHKNSGEYFKIVLPNKNGEPQVYFKGEKIIGSKLNSLFIEQLNLNYLTDTDNKHHSTLSISGYRLPYDQPTLMTEQFVASFDDLEKQIKHAKDVNAKEEQAKRDNEKRIKEHGDKRARSKSK